ncbi:acetylornithine deacetylase [Kineosphaera limosa]|uniref:Peptidase M20 dimerisation domain-containing protein n=1 Tax=Kineosphaera limosa NBRC 100340 TaxID=1184609 RepID=K6WFX6_9MICO|nr:M20 family metallopeptidase [Kineosphaera limosa]NYE00131.1 acetylornithine deacetylase [Kineosphaera limosa]GAB98190.1 hypothetical protein KILIM_110_00050 [Kineosphaera limosa NBRC 100340]
MSTGHFEPADVLAHIDPDEVVTVTQRLLRCAGTNPPGQEEATARELASVAGELGLQVDLVEVLPGRPNVVVTLPGGEGGTLLLLGHTDVVPVGDGWTRDPFGGELAHGRIYGRGATDMKGGLAASLVAMAAVRRAGVTPSGPVVLVAAVDEEENGAGIRAWIAGQVPSLRGCIVAEPTELQPIIAARGDSYLTVRVTGVASHAGNPGDGRNAIGGAAAIVADFERWHAELAQAPAVLDGLVGPATLSVGTIHGGQSTSMVAPECVLEVDRRLLPGDDPAQVLAAARARVEALDLSARGLSADVEMTMDMPGFATPADDPFVRATLAALVDAGTPHQEPGGWTAACDGGFVARDTDCPVVVLGPGSVTGQAHRPDESVGVQELVHATRTYALLAAH